MTVIDFLICLHTSHTPPSCCISLKSSKVVDVDGVGGKSVSSALVNSDFATSVVDTGDEIKCLEVTNSCRLLLYVDISLLLFGLVIARSRRLLLFLVLLTSLQISCNAKEMSPL